MARAKKPRESDEAPGAPEWMVTFSDCMTLLLTFFVLLLSFSSFDDRIFRNLKVVYSNALTNISPVRRSDRDSVVELTPITYTVELDKGSEKPTSTKGSKDGLLKETDSVNLHGGVAFLISSNKVFWGKGTTFSPEGRQTMDLIGSFLKRVSSRMVISENGPAGDQGSTHFGLPRAWAIMEYLTSEQGLDRERLSISQASAVAQAGSAPVSARSESERTVEIVLLERSVYN